MVLMYRLQYRFGTEVAVPASFEFYPFERIQKVCTTGMLSKPSNLDRGVPQCFVGSGSCGLAPILFILYVSPLEEIIPEQLDMSLTDDIQLQLT